MSSSSKATISSADDKRSKIEKLKEKKAAAQAARASTTQDKKPRASSNLFSPALCASRVTGNVVVLSPPRKVNKEWVFDARVTELAINDDVDGHARIPPLVRDSSFAISPLTDAKGGYIHKYGENFKKLDERKPLQLAEHKYTTVKLLDPPSAPVDWATPHALFPGGTVNIANPAVHAVFKSGVQLSAAYRPSATGSKTDLVDLEMPRLAFECVASDTALAHRNTLFSLNMGACREGWNGVDPADAAKASAITALTTERDDLLNPNGAWMTGFKVVANEGDAEWKSGVLSIANGLVDGAAFVNEGVGVTFAHAAHGPTMLVPIYGLGVEQSLDDGLPGENSKAFRVMSDDEALPPDQLPLFEGTMANPGSRAIFGSARKDDGRANGGPWLNMPVIFNAVASGTTECISLDTPFTLKISLTGMPSLVGSKMQATIKAVATTFLPLTDMVVAFEADRNNVASNDKAAETWDCRFSTVDFHSTLLKYGIELDTNAALEAFEDAPIQVEEKEAVSTYTTTVKPLLACGFVLLNESADARREDWLDTQVLTMEKILKSKGRAAECTYEIRAIDPRGFEEHKHTLAEFETVDTETRVGSIDVNTWPVYAVLKIDDAPPAMPPPAGPPPAKKQKKKA